jgi:hypothetical protein
MDQKPDPYLWLPDIKILRILWIRSNYRYIYISSKLAAILIIKEVLLKKALIARNQKKNIRNITKIPPHKFANLTNGHPII